MDSVIAVCKTAWKSERLVYRAIESDDEQLKKWIHKHIENDPAVRALIGTDILKPETRKESDSFTDRFPECLLGVAICLPAEPETTVESSDKHDTKDTIIGYVALKPVSPDIRHHRNADVGMALAEAYQGHGYGREALNWIIDWGFRHANLHRINISTISYNDRAISLYKKLGFKEEGRRREYVLFDRKWFDLVDLGMLEQEWEEMRRQM